MDRTLGMIVGVFVVLGVFASLQYLSGTLMFASVLGVITLAAAALEV